MVQPFTRCFPPDSALYAMTFVGGAAYDTTGDERVTRYDSVKVKTIVGARVTAPFIADRHLVFAAGNAIEMFGDPEEFNDAVRQGGVRLVSWRELR
jgi:hypothetical protein